MLKGFADSSCDIKMPKSSIAVSYTHLETYKIVGSTEADPINGRISDESPVGKSMLGHSVGDVVEVLIPSGAVSYELIEISK